MKEVFLYMCEECGMCMFESSDKGTASYSNYCAGCKQASFFKKVAVKHKYDMFCNYQGSCFTVEDKNGNINTKASNEIVQEK